MDHPRKFYEEYVKPSYEAWLKDRLNKPLAQAAVHHANVMAERLAHYENRGKSPTKFREELAKGLPDFGLVWDVDDAHKHLELSRPGRRVTSSRQTDARHTGGAWGGSWGGAWGNSWGGRTEIVVKLDNGDKKPLTDILKNVVEMWDDVLPKE